GEQPAAQSRAVDVRDPDPHGAPLLRDDRNRDLGADVGVELDAYAEFAQRADGLGQVDLALVDVDTAFVELALDVARGDGAVQLVLLADLHGEGDLHGRDATRLAAVQISFPMKDGEEDKLYG